MERSTEDMIVVRRYGDSGRPPVIVLHGGPGAAGHMGPIAQRLARSFQVFEPFQRGSGTQLLTVARHVADLHDVIDGYVQNLQPALLGASWGAMLALAYAAAHPSASGPIILVGCGTFDPVARSALKRTIAERTTDAIRQRLAQAEARGGDEGLKDTANALTPIYSYDPVALPHEHDEVDVRAHRETWDDMQRLLAEGFYPAAFATIKVPVLMVHGTYDPHPGRLIRRGLQVHLPQLEYCELDQCGHYPWIERAAGERFFTLVSEWLARCAKVPPSVSC